MTPPTAPERCPTCDRDECAAAATAALVASLTIPVTPGENGCACYGEFSRSHNPSRGCEIHGTDGSAALEAAWAAERAAREDCHAHRKDWHAEAIANRTAAVQWAKVAPLIEALRDCSINDGDDPQELEALRNELIAATEATP